MKREAEGRGLGAMTKLTLRYLKGYFVISGPEVKPTRFKSRREAKDWCQRLYPGSPIEEVATYAPKRSTNATSRRSGKSE